MQPDEDPARAREPGVNVSSIGAVPAGTVLHGRFLIEQELGTASSARGIAVFAVKDLKANGRAGVLKIAGFDATALAAESPSIADVAASLKHIAHPNIEEFFDCGRLPDGRPFALAAPAAGPLLDQAIRDGARFGLDRTGALVGLIAEGLAAAHAAGILHCDLRPSNVVFGGEIARHGARIVNFGTAWPVDTRGEGLVQAPAGRETLHYAAPELMVPLGHRSPASDIYSLAVLAYRLAAGRVPFAGTDRADMLRKINAGSAIPPPGLEALPLDAAELILAGLQFEPIERPRSIGEYGLLLSRALSPAGSIAVRPSAPAVKLAVPDSKIPPRRSRPSPRHAADAPSKKASVLSPEPDDLRPAVSDRALAWGLIGLLTTGALSIPAARFLLRQETASAAVETPAVRPVENAAAVHQLRYRLESPAPASGKPPPPAPQLDLVADTAGRIYVFSEYAGEDGRPAFSIIYPGAAHSAVEAGKALKVPAAGPSPQAIWLVWTAAEIAELEALRAAAKDGAVSDEDHRRRLRHFLERNRGLHTDAAADTSTGQTVLTGTGDRIVYRIEPESAS